MLLATLIGVPFIVLSSTTGEKGSLPFFRKSVHDGKSGYKPIATVAKEACIGAAKYDAKGERGLMAWMRFFMKAGRVGPLTAPAGGRDNAAPCDQIHRLAVPRPPMHSPPPSGPPSSACSCAAWRGRGSSSDSRPGLS